MSLATGLAESPLESLAWVLWHEAGLPRPVPQAVIRDRGRFIARVDFLWAGSPLIVEVDGLAKYAESGQLQREKQRQNALVRLGYVVLRYTWADIVHRPAMVVSQVRAALGLAA
jgi:very-short-patch-repair endonuclease